MDNDDIEGIQTNIPKLKVDNIANGNTSKAEYFSPVWSTDRMDYNQLYNDQKATKTKDKVDKTPIVQNIQKK